MRGLSIITICFLTFTVVRGQDSGQMERDAFVSIPREVALPVLVFQPASPMQFEMIERLLSTSGRGASNYRLRNSGSKPIRKYRIAYMFFVGTGGSWEWSATTSGELILPGQLAPSDGTTPKIVPLTDTLRDQMKLRLPMKTVIFFMVERVEFMDGSVYTDESTWAALKAYLDDNDDKVYQSTRRVPKTLP